VRFGTARFFERSLRLKASPIVASQAMDTARRVPSLEPEFLFSLLAVQPHRRSRSLRARWRQKI